MIYVGIDIAKLNHYAPENMIIGFESMSHYGNNLVANNYKGCVLNPIQTLSWRKDRIRKTKTDKVGTIVIAETLMMQRSYRFVTFYGLNIINLKTAWALSPEVLEAATVLYLFR